MKGPLQKQLLSATAKALRVAYHYPDPMISFLKLHKMHGFKIQIVTFVVQNIKP
jgi:hypothetical protein